MIRENRWQVEMKNGPKSWLTLRGFGFFVGPVASYGTIMVFLVISLSFFLFPFF